MKSLKIKNWLVNDEGITWTGTPQNDYYIAKERLAELGRGDRSKMYDWLVHLVEKTWIDEEDIYALNTALIYAFESFDIDFKTGSFVETFIEQQNELRMK